jgi:hypothetical protein
VFVFLLLLILLNIIIVIIIIISFMQGIYTYIAEKTHVPKGYNVAAILSLLFMAPILLVHALAPMYFYISNFRSIIIKFPCQLLDRTCVYKNNRNKHCCLFQLDAIHPPYCE